MPPETAPSPISPGDVLRDEMRERAGVTQDSLAEALGVSRFSVSQLINGRRGVTAEMALRLGQVLDTSPEFWLNLQREMDLHRARRKLGDALATLPVLRRAAS
jgi:addiction module HigA family antidote